jgi:hypothetical protein
LRALQFECGGLILRVGKLRLSLQHICFHGHAGGVAVLGDLQRPCVRAYGVRDEPLFGVRFPQL